MAKCVNCDKFRTAILHGRMAEAAGLTVEALRKKIGFKATDPVAEPVPDELPAKAAKVR